MVWTVATFYKFVPLENLASLRLELLERCWGWGLRGTILLASEGLNATVAGDRTHLSALLAWLRSHPAIGPFPHQESTAAVAPFDRLKVKLKREIVTLGVPEVNPAHRVGTYVEPQDWNRVLCDPEVVVIDSRNAFEVELGTFQGALNPYTDSFRDLPAYVAAHLNPAEHKKVALFCTGGIRCEKATAYLLNQGFEQVYHLRGGILNYLKTVPVDNSLWQGACFVFDERVAVDHHLAPTDHELCPGCGRPLSAAERSAPGFEAGMGCPHCRDRLTPEKRDRLAARPRG